MQHQITCARLARTFPKSGLANLNAIMVGHDRDRSHLIKKPAANRGASWSPSRTSLFAQLPGKKFICVVKSGGAGVLSFNAIRIRGIRNLSFRQISKTKV